jgi:hypothetical protein
MRSFIFFLRQPCLRLVRHPPQERRQADQIPCTRSTPLSLCPARSLMQSNSKQSLEYIRSKHTLQVTSHICRIPRKHHQQNLGAVQLYTEQLPTWHKLDRCAWHDRAIPVPRNRQDGWSAPHDLVILLHTLIRRAAARVDYTIKTIASAFLQGVHAV